MKDPVDPDSCQQLVFKSDFPVFSIKIDIKLYNIVAFINFSLVNGKNDHLFILFVCCYFGFAHVCFLSKMPLCTFCLFLNWVIFLVLLLYSNPLSDFYLKYFCQVNIFAHFITSFSLY